MKDCPTCNQPKPRAEFAERRRRRDAVEESKAAEEAHRLSEALSALRVR